MKEQIAEYLTAISAAFRVGRKPCWANYSPVEKSITSRLS